MAVWHRPGCSGRAALGSHQAWWFICAFCCELGGRAVNVCTSFPPSSGPAAMSIFRMPRWRSARGMIEWLCTQERWNPEGAIIIVCLYLARRLTTAGLLLAAAIMMRIRIIRRCTRGQFTPAQALWRASLSSYRPYGPFPNSLEVL
jgi:hypothetical protein